MRRLAEENGKTRTEADEIIKKQTIILHLNASILNKVTEDLIKNDYYGFNPDNIYMFSSPVIHGFKLGEEKGEFILDPHSPRLPVGHGEAYELYFMDNQFYKVNSHTGRPERQPGIPVEILHNKGIDMVRTQRINNLKMLGSDVINFNSLMYFVAHPEMDILVKLLANPMRQKGGSFVRHKKTGRLCLIETLALKAKDIKQVQDAASDGEWPYNEFTNDDRIYKIYEENGGKIPKLPRYLKYSTKDEDYLGLSKGIDMYTDSVTGDATQLDLKTGAFMQFKGDRINDFKAMDNLFNALKAAKDYLILRKKYSGTLSSNEGLNKDMPKKPLLTPPAFLIKNTTNKNVRLSI
jgi:hypothetical protein